MFFPRLFSERTFFDFGAKSREFGREELAHTHNVWTAGVVGGHGGNGNGFAETIDKVVT
jgi:hypothetical protein